MKISDVKTKLSQTVEYLKDELSSIRTGQSSTSLVENISIDAYGSKMKLVELANLSSDGGVIVITPWDKTNIDAIAASITKSDLGLTPNSDNERILINVPQLTEERRVEFTKLVGEKVEGAKISVRNIRQDALKSLDEMEDTGVISEDEKNSQKKQIEDEVKSTNEVLIKFGEDKKKALMTV